MDTRDHGRIRIFREPDPSSAVITHVGNLQGQQRLDPVVNPVNVVGQTTADVDAALKVIVDKEDYTTAAKDWLQSVGLG